MGYTKQTHIDNESQRLVLNKKTALTLSRAVDICRVIIVVTVFGFNRLKQCNG
jgi:hypothetical protein